MGRLVIGIGAASTLLVACNMLSGVDGLTSYGTEQQDVGAKRTDASAVPPPEERRDHESSGSSASSSGTSGGSIPDDAGVDAASEAAAGLPTFTDDFNRPNGNAVGNGWTEKTPGKFPLVSGAAQQSETGIYRNLFVSRPAAEDAVNVLVQGTITLATTTGDPCLFARIQAAASAPRDHFVGYSVYPDGPADLYISRDDGTVFNDLGHATIAPVLAVGTPYRLSLQVTGSNPVRVVGSISTLDGNVVASITGNDTTAKRITAAGSVGFGSSNTLNGRFDDFRRVTLPP